MTKSTAVRWTREHLLIALNLYRKIPFGKLHRRNPIIRQVAERMWRTANSLALKLVNFASLDPVLRATGRRGMEGASIADRRAWDEYQQNLQSLGPESEQLLHDLITSDSQKEVDLLRPDGIRLEKATKIGVPESETEALVFVKARRGQHFFRQSILS